jgi:hypothetical protein
MSFLVHPSLQLPILQKKEKKVQAHGIMIHDTTEKNVKLRQPSNSIPSLIIFLTLNCCSKRKVLHGKKKLVEHPND